MQRLIFSLCGIIILCGCNGNKTAENKTETVAEPVTATADITSNFFPVTSYFKGEILDIKNRGLTLLKTVTIKDKTDTSWIKIPDLDNAFAEFLFPVIDTANLKNMFAENKFLDQTLNAFTFSYDAVNDRSDTFAFKRWDVYVDPDNGKVTRIYLIKRKSADRELQLTWQSGKWYKIVTLHNVSGKIIAEREEKISRSYE